jgi:hypothetical protein
LGGRRFLRSRALAITNPTRWTDIKAYRLRLLTDELIEGFDRDLGGADDAAEGAAVEFVVKGHRDGRPAGAHEANVAAFLTKDCVAELRQGSDTDGSVDDGKRRHGQAATLMSTTS